MKLDDLSKALDLAGQLHRAEEQYAAIDGAGELRVMIEPKTTKVRGPNDSLHFSVLNATDTDRFESVRLLALTYLDRHMDELRGDLKKLGVEL